MFSFSETIREISDYKKFIVSDNKYFTASTFYNYKEQFYMQELSIYTGWGMKNSPAEKDMVGRWMRGWT